MPLRWDPLLTRALARELDVRLRGARLRAIRLDGQARDLALLFRDETLLWRLHPARGWLRFLPASEPAATDLRVVARVRRVRSPADERMMVFELLPARGGRSRDLIVELLGNQMNALVVEAPEGRIRHVLVRRGDPRPLRVGHAYTPPPPPDREGAEAPLAEERWMEILRPVPPPDRRRALVEHVAWTSPINARALVDADADPEKALAEGYATWTGWAHGDRSPAPVVLDLRGGPQPYPWPLPGIPGEPAPSLLEAFARAAASSVEDDEPIAGALLPPGLLARLEAALDDALRRRTRLEAEADAVEDPGALREIGDLLLARLGSVPQGAQRTSLESFDGRTVEVALDPRLLPHENAAAYYDRAAKAERARARLPGLVARAREDAHRLQALLGRARAGEADADQVRSALPRRQEGGGSGIEESLPYRTFRSSGGLDIRVGRSARLNDELTFHHSAPNDVWMHARHAAGAHVVLRWRGPGNPPARDLEEAAQLAALHSKARTSGTVAVDWTLRKYVRKPRGSVPGAVQMQRVRTLFVRPDPGVAERLATEG